MLGDDELEPDGGWVRGLIASLAVLVVLAGGGWLSLTLTRTAEPEQVPAARPTWQLALVDSTPESAAMEAAATWPGIEQETVIAACQSAEPVVNGVGCVSLRGNWAYIEQIGLPAILRLSGVQPRPNGQVLLIGIVEDQILLRHQGQELRVPARQLDRWWLGDFFVVWPDAGSLLRPGQSGVEVRQAKTLAAQLRHEPWTGVVDDIYDPSFTRWVEGFQRRNGLQDDGVIGPVTRLFLKAPHLEGPSLIRELNGAD